eukprot:1680409-Rhodomonas_salina.1
MAETAAHGRESAARLAFPVGAGQGCWYGADRCRNQGGATGPHYQGFAAELPVRGDGGASHAGSHPLR